MTTAGELKQDILRVYNAINKKIFNVGVKQQKVDFVGNKIIIVSRNSRVPVLKLLDENYPLSIRQLDHLLFQLLKRDQAGPSSVWYQLARGCILGLDWRFFYSYMMEDIG